MIERLFKDQFLNGFIIGFFSIGLEFLVLKGIDFIFNQLTSIDHLFSNDRISLIVLAINIILFRFMIVKWGRIQSGKGLFVSIITAVLVYFLLNRYFKQI